MTALLQELETLYPRGDAAAAGALRLTDRGIWHATPLVVLAAAVPLVGESNLLESRGRPLCLLDAGAGDGRLLAALALGLPRACDVWLLGLECDGALVNTARETLATLGSRSLAPNRKIVVAEGDFFDPLAYARLDVAPRDLDLVFNYPDGNERRLLQWLAGHGGPETRLVILSPDHDPALGQRAEGCLEVRPEGDAAAPWSLTVFAPSSTGRW